MTLSLIACAFSAETRSRAAGLGPGRHPHCTRCAWKAELFSGPEGYAQNPRGRIGLRFVREYYVHRPFLCTTLRRNVKAPPIWGHDSSQCHGTQESAKSLMLSGITVTFRTLFLRFDISASLGAVGGPASRRPWEPSFFSSIMCRYPSRFEVCGGTRDDNLTRPLAAASPLVLWRCASPAAQGSTSQIPARGIIGHTQSFCSRVQRPVSAAARQGRVNLTPRCIILTCSQLQKWRQTHFVHRSPLAFPSRFNGLVAIRLAGKRPVSTETGRKHRPGANG